MLHLESTPPVHLISSRLPGEQLFELEAASFSIPGRVLLQPLTLSLPAKQVVGLIGHNGSGKSTLVKLLARQQAVTSGVIRFEGKALKDWGYRPFARKVAYLRQQTPAATGMLVKELVALGRYTSHGALGRYSPRDQEAVDEAMVLTDIVRFADRLVDTLSGGERQRVWLAMLVAQDAECLLLDEPISALELAHRRCAILLFFPDMRQRRVRVIRQCTLIVFIHHVDHWLSENIDILKCKTHALRSSRWNKVRSVPS